MLFVFLHVGHTHIESMTNMSNLHPVVAHQKRTIRSETADITLSYTIYGHTGSGIPIICLAGLTRDSRDFHDLAMYLCVDHPIYCLDCRGRGASSHDPAPENYTPLIEAMDVVQLVKHLELTQVIIIGTSRGGILGMLFNILMPDTLQALILNDIGAEINPKGLVRIMSYLGNGPAYFKDWATATVYLKETQSTQYPKLSEKEWDQYARRTFIEDSTGRITTSYDNNLKLNFVEKSTAEIPDLWPQFLALGHIPVLLIHGELSDILSSETVNRMSLSKPDIDILKIRDVGHVPFLTEKPCMERISRFLRGIRIKTIT